MLTDEQIETIAHDSGKNKPQRNAVEHALRTVNTLLADQPVVHGEARDTTIAAATPAAPVVIAVGSVPEVTKAQEAEIWKRLDKALALYGSIEIVTFGGRGCEIEAHRWARARNQTTREFAVAWTVVQPDGSTRRDGRALQTRERKLKAYMAAADHVFSLVFTSADDERTSKRVTALHSTIRKWHPVKRPQVQAATAEEAIA